MEINNISELTEYAKRFACVEELLNDYLIFHLKNDKTFKKFIKRYNEYKPDSKYPYYEIYLWQFKIPHMMELYWDDKIFTPKKVEDAMILKHGCNHPDGWAGIQIKKLAYRQGWIVEILDGCNGQQFIKSYKEFPTKEQICQDSIFNPLLYNDGKEYKPSLKELFIS